ncbi:PhoX family phosphatase [Streptomyces sp. XM4193]|uniref:PhoX family protein n=1 Tax=Streptomyces sp. XM4193 TaxID=2929782 RepID=UPI001FFBCBB9|nr:PhoX family phosphatase [Streptomyces sp. XM4193]MCK1795278.1 PhoX family phosphatase [Streptomyces sp. XM4193]
MRRLPLLSDGRHSSRAPETCLFRCGNACAGHAPNTSGNRYFGSVLRDSISRRNLLGAGAVALAAPLIPAASAAASQSAGSTGIPAGTAAAGVPGNDGAPAGDHLGFPAVPPDSGDRVTVPEGFEYDVLIRWGDPVLAGAPPFDFDNQTEAAQSGQFGPNNDYCALVPLRSDGRWLMVSNHEYVNELLMFPGWDPEGPSEEHVRTSWAAYGMSVVLVERPRAGGRMRARSSSRWNRRITLHTPFEMRGPAAGSPLLRTGADPTGRTVLGTMANCAGGTTPWGTVLSGEENVHMPFAHAEKATDPVVKEGLKRYGFAEGASLRAWEKYDERFDLGKEPHEAHRFGWIVEVDPSDPESVPVKHTALGRFKHEGATISVAPDGRVVAYMGDDERFEYVYKFVSDKRMRKGEDWASRRHNMGLLDSGTLYAARFTGDSPAEEIDGSGQLPSDGEFDGTGNWLPLAHNDRSFVPGMTSDEVYVFTRIAADRAGATRMDRPEDVEADPRTGRVYAALTNNDYRGAAGQPGPDEANPRKDNRDGHVLELCERRDDPTSERFVWRLMLVCGDPESPSSYYAGYDKSRVSAISCPDNLAFDPAGNMWIATDSGGQGGVNDGLYMVPLSGPERGRVQRFLTIPAGAECCGPVVGEDHVLVSVQHPGEMPDATPENPASHWPDGGDSQPRAAVIAVRRKDGGPILRHSG